MPHFLNVYDLGDGSFDRWVDHEDDCPTQKIQWLLGDGTLGEFNEAIEFTCGVGYWESMYGYEDLEDDPRFRTPGRYKIDFYNEKVFQSEEYDSFLFFVEEDF